MAEAASISVRLAPVTGAAAGGCLAHDLRIGPQPNYVDRQRSGLNRVLVMPPPPSEILARTLDRRQRAGPVRALRSSAAIATSGIITFSRAAQEIVRAASPAAQDAAYEAVARRIAAHYRIGLLGLVVHADESAPHAHMLLDRRTESGAALKYHGREVQDLAAEAIAGHFPGIGRGTPKAVRKARGEPRSKWVHRSVRQLHGDLPAEIEAVEEKRDQAQARAAEMAGRVRKLEEKAGSLEGLNAKEEKRLEAYRGRLEARRQELGDAEAELTRLRRELDETQAELEQAQAGLAAAREETEMLGRPVSAAGMLTGSYRQRQADSDARAAARAAAAAGELERGRQELEKERRQLRQEHAARMAELEDGRARQEAAAETALQATLDGICTPAEKKGHWMVHDEAEFNRLKNRGRFDPGPLGRTDRLWSFLRRAAAAMKDAVVRRLTAERDAARNRADKLAGELDAARQAGAEDRRRITSLEADLDRTRTERNRLLEVAIEDGREDVIDEMLPSIDDLDAPLAGHNRSGTALHLAAEVMRPAMVLHLVKAGADPDIADREGLTPADLVLEAAVDAMPSAAVRELIEACGAGTGITEPARMTPSGLVRHLLRHMNGDRQAIAQLLPAAALENLPDMLEIIDMLAPAPEDEPEPELPAPGLDYSPSPF